ncbi:UNVERIFIED_CONTAM: Phospholipase D delta [Sesamum angustifolium]|uniref:Phospholipase D delta n=1 Tax=Sesamum angustifolium TaxID=2727405 RepID=A0AAW2KLW4_9LAMI
MEMNSLFLQNAGVDHLIPMELAMKIASKIRANERFAVYVVLPMWPEGNPKDNVMQEILFWQACALDSAASDDGRRHGHMRESADGLLACVGVMARGWCTAHGTLLGWSRKRSGVVRTGCAARGRAGLASVVSVGRRARAWASRRPCAETFGGCAHGRAQARTALGRLADGWHKMRPMCGKTRQAGRPRGRARQHAQVGRQASCARTGSAARAHSRQADDCRQRPRLGGWLRMLKHKTCAGHVMGRLRLVTAHLHGNSGKLQARRLWTVFHSGCRQFWSVFPSSWGCQLHCCVFICFSRIGHGRDFEC